LKTGFIDMAAALFVIGGVVSLVVSFVGIPIYSLYPFQMQFLSLVVAVVVVVGLICSLGAIHCYTLVTKRLMSDAGFRGIIFGAILLTFSLGLGEVNRELNTGLGTASAILILIAGAISYVMREIVLPRPPLLVHQETIQSQ
jgi:hypothetical protein